MRKFILIAAMVLTSATAQAGDSRSLTTGLSTSVPDNPPAVAAPPRAPDAQRAENATPPVPDTPPAAEAPRYTARPAPVDSTPAATPPVTRQELPRQAHVRPVREDYVRLRRPHYRWHYWSQARVVSMLHRYGIYW